MGTTFNGVDIIYIGEDMLLEIIVIREGYFYGNMGMFIIPFYIECFGDEGVLLAAWSSISTNSTIPPSL